MTPASVPQGMVLARLLRGQPDMQGYRLGDTAYVADLQPDGWCVLATVDRQGRIVRADHRRFVPVPRAAKRIGA